MAEKDQACPSASSCGQSSCEGCPSRQQPGENPFRADQNPYSDVRHVIGVVSGKGGVGKSFVTASIANALAASGARVGILDADITGPSIPKMYGLTKQAEALAEDQIIPELTENGIKVMSLNLLVPDPEQAVVWRGPIIAGMVKQFWTDVVWGELDYLLVDMPPGTGDAPLTVFQSLPVDGVVVVATPQELVGMIVAKAIKMARMMSKNVIALVENMSYFKCPDCGSEHEIFGPSRAEETAKNFLIPHTVRMPIDPELARKVDDGAVESVGGSRLDTLADVIEKL